MGIAGRIGLWLLPAARFWIRYVPFPLFKALLWKNFSWRSRDFSVRTHFGSKVIGRSTDLVQGYIYYFGVWEPNLTRWVTERLHNQADRVFIDVGANIGYFTLLAAKEMGAGSQVVAIEASPHIHNILAENIALNRLNNVRSICCAAVAENCKLNLYHGDGSNMGATTTRIGKIGNPVGIEVTGMPLSEILSDRDVRLARLIKVDVEGAEWSALQGLLPVFSRLPEDIEFIVEVSPETLGAHDLAKIFEVFEMRGFIPYIIENSYNPYDYLFPIKIAKPKRMTNMPTKTVDMIFSRTKAEHLA
jgi:FkbM family methyltransferase